MTGLEAERGARERRTYIEQGKAASPLADAGGAVVVAVVVAMATACEAFGGRRRGPLAARSVVRLGRSAQGERGGLCAPAVVVGGGHATQREECSRWYSLGFRVGVGSFVVVGVGVAGPVVAGGGLEGGAAQSRRPLDKARTERGVCVWLRGPDKAPRLREPANIGCLGLLDLLPLVPLQRAGRPKPQDGQKQALQQKQLGCVWQRSRVPVWRRRPAVGGEGAARRELTC